LGREFEETGATAEESATNLGGVLMFGNQKWLVGAEDLPSEQAAHELRAYEESLVTIMEDGDYEHIGQSLIALTFTMSELTEKYGFELTGDAAEECAMNLDWSLRVGQRDDEMFALTRDYRIDRVTVTVKQGFITKVDVG